MIIEAVPEPRRDDLMVAGAVNLRLPV